MISFDVVDDESITDDELYELAERIVAQIDPDPPVLVYDESSIDHLPGGAS